MVPMDWLTLEEKGTDNSEDRERYAFLDDLQLHQAERSPVYAGAETVSRNHKGILEQSHAPGKEDYSNERPAVGYVHF